MKRILHVLALLVMVLPVCGCIGSSETATTATPTYDPDPVETADPTLKEIVVDDSTTSHGITVRLEKIQFASTETRIYIWIENSRWGDITYDRLNNYAIFRDVRYDAIMDTCPPGTAYPEIPNIMHPEMLSRGKVLFEGMDYESTGEMSLFIRVQTGDNDVGDMGALTFTFDVDI
jgi:hypothetical protein